MSTPSPRVRFAPSPTGYLHVGGARTAIFNWLFARRNEGTFVLRIEDTDVERSTEESESSLRDDLRWLGLEWDEGPVQGGSYSPYRQSERLDLYAERASALMKAGKAYPCFCSDDRLEKKRKATIKAGKPPRYDGTCRDLTADEVAAQRKAGDREVVRFIVPEGVVRFEDLVRGDVEIANDTVGDFVLVRSTGHPTYNFAVAVDDHLMGITHVLRGEEHLPNTLRQILLYRALDVDIPQFAHLPLILAEDRSKLSKRHAASSVGELRDMGYLPKAVVNYLVLLGWSHPEGKEIIPQSELIETFSLERVNKSAAVYDKKKLLWMNGQYIRSTPVDELFPLAERYFPKDIHAQYDEAGRREILALLHDGIETLADIEPACAAFRLPLELDGEAKDVLKGKEAATVLDELGRELRRLDNPLTADGFKRMMKAVGKTTGIKGKSLFFPTRAAITGSVRGPDLAGVAALKGRETVTQLVERAQSLQSG